MNTRRPDFTINGEGCYEHRDYEWYSKFEDSDWARLVDQLQQQRPPIRWGVVRAWVGAGLLSVTVWYLVITRLAIPILEAWSNGG